MDFWGTEVKKGLTEIVKIPPDTSLHITHACLGPNAAPNERVFLECEIDNSKVVLCCLHASVTDNVVLKNVFAAHHGTISLSVLGSLDSNASVYVTGHLLVDDDPGELGDHTAYVDDDEDIPDVDDDPFASYYESDENDDEYDEEEYDTDEEDYDSEEGGEEGEESEEEVEDYFEDEFGNRYYHVPDQYDDYGNEEGEEYDEEELEEEEFDEEELDEDELEEDELDEDDYEEEGEEGEDGYVYEIEVSTDEDDYYFNYDGEESEEVPPLVPPRGVKRKIRIINNRPTATIVTINSDEEGGEEVGEGEEEEGEEEEGEGEEGQEEETEVKQTTVKVKKGKRKGKKQGEKKQAEEKAGEEPVEKQGGGKTDSAAKQKKKQQKKKRKNAKKNAQPPVKKHKAE